MKTTAFLKLAIAALALAAGAAHAQLPVTATTNQEALLASAGPHGADEVRLEIANPRL